VDGSSPPIDISPRLSPHNAYQLSPDGKWVVYYAPSDIFSVRSDGRESPRALFFRKDDGFALSPRPPRSIAPRSTRSWSTGDNRNTLRFG